MKNTFTLESLKKKQRTIKKKNLSISIMSRPIMISPECITLQVTLKVNIRNIVINFFKAIVEGIDINLKLIGLPYNSRNSIIKE